VKSADAKLVAEPPETNREMDFRELLLPFSFMKESPLFNATSIDVDLKNLSSIYLSVADALDISRPIAVRLVDSSEMILLNTTFRACPENTDVLTFPSGLADPLPLGDIAISIPYAMEQAKMRNVSLENELAALLVHGCLHLVGYDDIEDHDRFEMQQKMNEVGKQIGIPIDGEWTSILHQEIEHQ
jgi:probable rRNA maturation factor